MSDLFHDAHRPANRPKGMGWWPEAQQAEYCQKIWDRGDRDFWLIGKMRSLKLIADPVARQAYEEHHPEWVAEVRARQSETNQ